jgi:hypothetical protein
VGRDFCLARRHGSETTVFAKTFMYAFQKYFSCSSSQCISDLCFLSTRSMYWPRTPPPPSTLPYPASLRVSFLVCICGGTLGMGTEYSYFTTITPTCLCNYRLYRTFWCSGGTSVISWPAYGLGNRGSSEARISFSTACIQRSTYSEYGGSSSRCSSVPAWRWLLSFSQVPRVPMTWSSTATPAYVFMEYWTTWLWHAVWPSAVLFILHARTTSMSFSIVCTILAAYFGCSSPFECCRASWLRQ